MGTRLLQAKTHWAKLSVPLLPSGYSSVRHCRFTLKRVRSVGIVSQRVGNTAASAVFDYAALLAERRRLGRTTATAVGSLSSPNGPAITSRVFTHSVYVQLYT